jgi:hypothetical protein
MYEGYVHRNIKKRKRRGEVKTTSLFINIYILNEKPK